MKKIITIIISLLVFSGITYSQWQLAGPPGGAATSIAVSVSDIFVGTGTELKKTTDNGQSFIQTTCPLPTCISLAIRGNEILAGSNNSGLSRSTDNGATWIATNISAGTVPGIVYSTGGVAVAIT